MNQEDWFAIKKRVSNLNISISYIKNDMKLLIKDIKKMEKKMAEKWIANAIKKPGALRKTLKVKAGEKIPEKKLEKAEHSKNKTTAKRARLAETLKGFKK